MTVMASELKDFAQEILSDEGCFTLTQCFACGSCSSACPVEKVVADFDPRKIVHMVALGMEERLLSSDTIWACSQCQSCVPVCPQNVRCSDVIKALRRNALEKGYVTRERLYELGMFAAVNEGKCIACLTCVRLCPFEVPVMKPEGCAYIDLEKCKACGICVLECPAQAIDLKPSLELLGMKGGINVQ